MFDLYKTFRERLRSRAVSDEELAEVTKALTANPAATSTEKLVAVEQALEKAKKPDPEEDGDDYEGGDDGEDPEDEDGEDGEDEAGERGEFEAGERKEGRGAKRVKKGLDGAPLPELVQLDDLFNSLTATEETREAYDVLEPLQQIALNSGRLASAQEAIYKGLQALAARTVQVEKSLAALEKGLGAAPETPAVNARLDKALGDRLDEIDALLGNLMGEHEDVKKALSRQPEAVNPRRPAPRGESGGAMGKAACHQVLEKALASKEIDDATYSRAMWATDNADPFEVVRAAAPVTLKAVIESRSL